MNLLPMILKMSLATVVYILVTWIVWRFWARRKPGIGPRILVGLIFGACSVLSNHISVDYGHMLLNVRDIGPLAAGLFFDPLSGIIAGVVGGTERFIAGELWGLGRYTQLACSVSTVLAGFLPVILRFRVHRNQRPSVLYSFSLGAVTEVFHMYMVYLTHRDDVRTAYEVVEVCAFPMIVFTALGLAACSLVVTLASGEASGLFHRKQEQKTLAHKFRFWLMLGTALIFLVNFVISFWLQTQTALETADYKLNDWSEDLNTNLQSSLRYSRQMLQYIRNEILSDLHVIATGLEHTDQITSGQLNTIRYATKDRGIYLLSSSGTVLVTGGEAFPSFSSFTPESGYPSIREVFAGSAQETLLTNSEDGILAVVRCGSGFLCSYASFSARINDVPFDDVNSAFSEYALPKVTDYLLLMDSGEGFTISSGSLPDSGKLSPAQNSLLRGHLDGKVFYSEDLFVPGLCLFRPMSINGLYSLVIYRADEAFADRDSQAYENTFSDILIFWVLYLIISTLIDRMVIRPLGSVNTSLNKITAGNLEETVSVRSSAEFEVLSDDINATVDTLKGYINAAEKRMEKDLLLAKTIQAAALPRNFTFPRTDFELYATMDPAQEVGGDFYDFFFVGPSRLALVIADVSGKSIPGALFMMRAKAAIRNTAESGVSSPAEIFRRANRFLCEGNDAEMFVTAWIGIIDLNTGKIECANAGHEYPMICRAGGQYELFRDKHALALAVMEGAPMKEYTLEFNPGDRLFVYTDGIPEAINRSEEAYGAERLLAALNGHLGDTQEQLLKAVREDLSAFVGEAEPFDDVTMLGFEYTGTPSA